MKLKINDSAPDFLAPDQNGKMHSLHDYQGKWLLLYFYPKNNSPGWIMEAYNLKEDYERLKDKISILGISCDSVESHKNMVRKHELPFTLLSDPDYEMIDAYDLKSAMFAKRAAILIDPDGKIVKIYEKIKPQTFTKEIVKDLEDYY